MSVQGDLPDLNEIPRTEWREALAPLTDRQRRRAVLRVRDAEAQGEGMVLATELWLEEPPRRTDVPVPELPRAAAVTARDETRAVSFRLSHDEYARLSSLAKELSLRPTTLARLLVVRGVDASERERAA